MRLAEAPGTDSVTEGVAQDTDRNLQAEVAEVAAVVGQKHLRACVGLALRYSRRDREARDLRNHLAGRYC